MTRLKETSEECDLHNISHEDVILLIATMHCNKEELRKDIKRYRNPTWLAVEQLAENYKRSMVDEEPHKVGQVKRQDNKKKKKSNGKPSQNTQQLQGKCFRCGSTGHKSNDCKLDRSNKCLSCGKAGHLAKVCLSSPTKDTASAKKIEIKEEIAETAPDSSESCSPTHINRSRRPTSYAMTTSKRQKEIPNYCYSRFRMFGHHPKQ